MILIDGIAGTQLPADDRGLHYGDGLFETLALIDGHPQHWQRHLARLARGAARLDMQCPPAAHWQADLDHALRTVPPRPRRVLKLLLTRGSGGRGYAPPHPARPRRILQLTDWPAWSFDPLRDGICLALCDTPLGRNPCLAGLKHLNRLEQVLGAAEVAASGADEGLMFDDRDELVEGTRTNVFVALGDTWLTPALDAAGIAGILRELVLEFAPAAGIAVREARIPRGELANADEIFVCNSLAGIWPVRELGGACPRRFPHWPRTLQIVAALRTAGALA